METPTYLQNYQTVVDALGYWPRFHDGEVRSLVMDRNRILFDNIADARIELVIHAWELSDKANEKGHLTLSKHHLVQFEFFNVRDVVLKDFNHQNAILGLTFTDHVTDPAGNHTFKVTLEPANGLHGSFTAFGGRVVSVTPCDKNGKAEEV